MCQNVSTCVNMLCQYVCQHVRICVSVSEFVSGCVRMCVRMCQNVSGCVCAHVNVCQDVSECVRMCQDATYARVNKCQHVYLD